MIGAELQKAIFSALTADPALCDGRVYDNPPDDAQRLAATGAAWPYLAIGDDQVVDDGNTCSDGWEAFADIHVWSRALPRSKIEAKTLIAAVVERLSLLSTVDGFDVLVAALETSRTFRDPDGITEHGVVTMRFLLDPA
ncbi:Protein of unknown function [Kaistia soli DSM 19436]|uniref:DUF3168 domain-containing protein n=1 Tax=Kaistia soli DSM 19436 TaxID=1122133 RepID=A0A1M4YI73_9HYPH|nr:DUF3168 domain-containing protein [Kaistia soli]SHF05390.1 Protein of unknown function [Kaistia soli DSM 19436]